MTGLRPMVTGAAETGLRANGMISAVNGVSMRFVVPTVVGWLVVAGAYFLVAPHLGVHTPVTWVLVALGWAGAVLGPALAAVKSGHSRRSAPTAAWAGCAALAVAALMLVGVPTHTRDNLYQRHRAELDRLASLYRAGHVSHERALPAHLVRSTGTSSTGRVSA